MIDSFNNTPDDVFIIFADYSYKSTIDDHIEYPIPLTQSSFYTLNLNLNLSFTPNQFTLYSDFNYLIIMEKYSVPYYVIKLDCLPNILFTYLLYPEDTYFKHKFKNLLTPTVFINFYDINNHNQFIGNYKLPSPFNWFDICSVLTQNKPITPSIFEGLVYNFSSQSLVTYFYDTYF